MMGTQAQPLRQSRFALLLARPWASRLIATLGIVVMTVGLYVPVAGRDLLVDGGLIRHSRSDTWTIGNLVRAPFASLHLERMPLPVYLGFEAVYSLLTLGGVALIPVLWRPLSPKGTAVVRWAYGVWLLLLTLLAAAGLPAWWQFMSQPPQGSSGPATLEASYLVPGAAVFPLGVLLSGAALALMLREPLPRLAPAPTPRTGWQWTAALLLTIGALVWGIGFYLMPEATNVACPPVIFSVTQFAHGACAGLDSDQVLVAAYMPGLNPLALILYTLGRNFELLVAAGGITTLDGWTRQLSVKTLAWLAVWPVLALGVALVALQGAGVIAQHGFQLTVATSVGWHVGPGMVVTFVGIGLVALGQVGLWRELVRRKGAASAQ